MSWTVIGALTLLYWSALLIRMRVRGRQALARAVEQTAAAQAAGEAFRVTVPIEVHVPRAIGAVLVFPVALLIVRVVIHAVH